MLRYIRSLKSLTKGDVCLIWFKHIYWLKLMNSNHVFHKVEIHACVSIDEKPCTNVFFGCFGTFIGLFSNKMNETRAVLSYALACK